MAAKKIPIKGKRNILITSALPYVNNVPHLGNIIGCVLSADVFARYCRLRGYNVLYICGTDEYGTTTETKVLEENSTPRQICDKYHAIHKEVYEWFNISFDTFGRTSTPQQTEICQAIFKKILENNWISENSMHQVCQTAPHIRDTNHLFLELPLLKDKLLFINKMSVAGSWSQNAIQITNGRLKKGLKSRCITRDLKWGVPVPLERFSNKMMFPSTLLGTGENWTLMKTISVTEYLNYETGKFSKSKGIGVFGNDAKDTNIAVEVKLKQGLKIRMSISSEGNGYLQVLEQLNLPPDTPILLENGDIDRVSRPWEILPVGHKFGTPAPLFKELKDEEVEFFREKFAGSQADRIVRAEAEAEKIAEKLKKTKVSDSSGKKQWPVKPATESKAKANAETEISITRLDICVGLTTSVQKHPDADSLYIEDSNHIYCSSNSFKKWLNGHEYVILVEIVVMVLDGG
ncbi:hypothetical protein SO802_001062 [Lithocarpus litseifolius]|uniref:Methionyl-tRNA synthetase n=1 Tax=Lithocarpus litseifolius TaxID=425828 RepID=A0AAW2DWS6_9ROSI